MTKPVYFHIGAPKTGTTYLQHVLARNRTALAEEGICYPGRGSDHWFAAQDLLEWDFGGWHNPQIDGAWQQLVEEVKAWDGPVVISHEMFSAASDEKVKAAVAAFGDTDLHVVYTARDLSRLIPAAWQEDMKNRWSATFSEALESLRRGGNGYPPASDLWRRQDTPAVLERWEREIPVDRIHVVTTPNGGPPDVLWRRFASLIGVDTDAYDTSVHANQSLGIGEAEMLRRLNLTLGEEDVSWAFYHRIVKHQLAHGVLAPRSASAKVVLPDEHYEWVARWSRERADQIREAGYDVIGDLEELIPGSPVEGRQAAEESEVATAGVTAVAALVERLATVQDQQECLRERFDAVAHERDAASRELDQARHEREEAREIVREHRELPPWERVKRTVVELEPHVRSVRRVLAGYRRVRRLIPTRE